MGAVAHRAHRWSETTGDCLACGVDQLGWEVRSLIAGSRSTCDPQPQGGVARLNPYDRARIMRGKGPAPKPRDMVLIDGEQYPVTCKGLTTIDVDVDGVIRSYPIGDVVLV